MGPGCIMKGDHCNGEPGFRKKIFSSLLWNLHTSNHRRLLSCSSPPIGTPNIVFLAAHPFSVNGIDYINPQSTHRKSLQFSPFIPSLTIVCGRDVLNSSKSIYIIRHSHFRGTLFGINNLIESSVFASVPTRIHKMDCRFELVDDHLIVSYLCCLS